MGPISRGPRVSEHVELDVLGVAAPAPPLMAASGCHPHALAGAAAINDQPLTRIEVHGKQLFYFFGEDPARQTVVQVGQPSGPGLGQGPEFWTLSRGGPLCTPLLLGCCLGAVGISSMPYRVQAGATCIGPPATPATQAWGRLWLLQGSRLC